MNAYQNPIDPTAVQGRRIGAWIVDVIIILALGFLASIAFPIGETVFGNECEARGVTDSFLDSDDLEPSETSSTDSDFEMCFSDGDFIMFSETESSVINLGNSLWPNLISLAYVALVFWVWQGLSGMTPGKAMFGLRTVNESGEAPGVLKAFLRWLLWIVDAFPYCCFVPLVGGITMLASTGHRRVGDMAAKTYVVGKESMGAGPIIVPGKDGPPAFVPPSGPPPTGFTAPPPGGTIPPPPAGFGGAASTGPITDEPSVPPAPSSDAQWDPQRNAYIQWDAEQNAWLQFDDVSQTWTPIST